jgi:hypothetical protein
MLRLWFATGKIDISFSLIANAAGIYHGSILELTFATRTTGKFAEQNEVRRASSEKCARAASFPDAVDC